MDRINKKLNIYFGSNVYFLFGFAFNITSRYFLYPYETSINFTKQWLVFSIMELSWVYFYYYITQNLS